MKLKIILCALGTTLLLTPSLATENSGESLFKAKCTSCHVMTRPSDISTLVAPPAMGVMRHVKMKYGTKDDAVKFIVDYALNPLESKAVCESDKIKRFGLMPSQKGNVSKEELITIASWMYDNFGNGGQNKGHGKNCKKK